MSNQRRLWKEWIKRRGGETSQPTCYKRNPLCIIQIDQQMPHIRRTFRFCINRILEPNQPILLFWFMTCLFLSRRNMFHLFNLWFWFIFHVWHFITEIKRKKKKREMNESIYRHSCICNFDPPKPPCTLLKKEIEFRSCNIPIQSLTFSLLSQCGVNEVTIRWTSFLLLLSPPTHTHTPLFLL